MEQHLLMEIINWCSQKEQKLVIGISGHGAAGKTTFAKRLISLLPDNPVNYINTDPYLVDSYIRKFAIIEYTYQNEKHRHKLTASHPVAHHLSSLERDLQMVRKGLDFYTINTHYQKSTLISSKNKVTIVEGMSVAFIDPELFDLKIYFYTDEETELARRMERDVMERGSNPTFLTQSHKERRIQYELFMHPYSQQFDLIIKTNQEGIQVEKIEVINSISEME